MIAYDASYDPSDDKLRIRASARLDAETYARVKAAGFGWAPKQDLFYAVWTPAREDLALELAGDIEDESTSLEERAAQRAERTIEQYDGAPAVQEALAIMIDCYRRLGLKDLQANAEAVYKFNYTDQPGARSTGRNAGQHRRWWRLW